MDITPELVEAELEKLRDLPTPIAWWEVETGPDWTDDPAVWVWPVLERRGVDFDTRDRLRRRVRETVFDLARRERENVVWVYVGFRGAWEELAKAS